MKTIILAIITLGFALLFGLVTKSVFELQLIWWKAMLYPSLILIPFLSFWGLFLYFVKNRWLNYFLAVLISIVILLTVGFSNGLVIAAFTLLICAIISQAQIQSDINSRIKVTLYNSLKPGLKTIYLGLCLVIAMTFFYTPWAHTYDEGIKIPTQYQIIILSQAIPQFHPGMTVNELVRQLVSKEQELPEDISQIPPEQLNEIRQKALKELGLAELNLNGNEVVSEHPEIINLLITKQIGPTWQKIADFLPPIFTFVVFEIALILGYLIIPLSILVLTLIYQLMLALKLIKIDEIPEKKQVVEF